MSSSDLIKARIMNVMRNLPPLPEVTQQLLSVMRDENASADDVTKVLSGDPALAGKVLKLVNSSFYRVSSEVTTISRAVVLLGFTGIRNLALSFGSMEALAQLGGGLDMTSFWSHAIASASAAQTLAPMVQRRTDPEEAFLAGLMHDIGAYVLAAAVPDVYQEILTAPAAERHAEEKKRTGFTHAQVGQGLLKLWDLPEPFSDAARHHHDYAVATGGEQPLTGLIALADILACIHVGHFDTDATEADLQKLLTANGVEAPVLLHVLSNMDEKIGDMEAFMKIAGANGGAVAHATGAGKLKCVILTSDDERRQWMEMVLTHFGHDVYPMQSYLNQDIGCHDADLALVDHQCITHQQLSQLLTFLETQPARVAMIMDESATLPDHLAQFPGLPRDLRAQGPGARDGRPEGLIPRLSYASADCSIIS